MPFLVKAGCSERPFARLHRPVRFRIDRGKVTAPGLFLRCHTEFCLDPFGSELRSSLPAPFFLRNFYLLLIRIFHLLLKFPYVHLNMVHKLVLRMLLQLQLNQSLFLLLLLVNKSFGFQE